MGLSALTRTRTARSSSAAAASSCFNMISDLRIRVMTYFLDGGELTSVNLGHSVPNLFDGCRVSSVLQPIDLGCASSVFDEGIIRRQTANH